MVLLEDLYCGLSPVFKLVNFSFELFGRLSLKSKDNAKIFLKMDFSSIQTHSSISNGTIGGSILWFICCIKAC